MKKFILLLAFIIATPVVLAESSEDIYTLDQACILSLGSHMGQITSLQNDRRFQDVITDSNYSIWSFHRLDDAGWGGSSLFFVANHKGDAGAQKYSELFLVNCLPTNWWTSHFPIHRIEQNIQYSPEIVKITDSYILLDDWQTVSGKVIHVANIFDRKSSKFYPIRDAFIKSIKPIKAFSKNKAIFWSVLSFEKSKAKLEIRLESGRKMSFMVKL